MDALLAAGGGLPLGLHLPHVVEQAGSLAGFAAVAGLAILSALYFSQARDLRRLREWAGRAPERAAEQAITGAPAPSPVPGRVVAVPQRPGQPVQPGAPAGAPAAATAAAAAAGAGSATGVTAPATAPATGANGSGEPTVTKTGDGEGGDAAPEGADGGAADPDAPKDGEAASDEAAKEGDAAKDGDAEEAKEGEGADTPGEAARPGMPAPASAAAAAGAGAASVSGPAASSAPSPSPAPAAAPAARPPVPQRTPTSVLPPRTGSLPPVRRAGGGTASANRALGPAAAEPPKRPRNPAYVVLAVAGVLILGAGAAIGVPKLVNGDNKSSKSPAKHKKAAKAKAAPVAPGSITVAVLNGTSVTGLATQLGDEVQNFGFNTGTISNAPSGQQNRTESLVMYAPGHQREARMVARKLKISSGVEPLDGNSRDIAGDATVVVIVGSDRVR